MTDIVKRLRDRANGVTWHWSNSEEMAAQAADEIENLRAALKAALMAHRAKEALTK